MVSDIEGLHCTSPYIIYMEMYSAASSPYHILYGKDRMLHLPIDISETMFSLQLGMSVSACTCTYKCELLVSCMLSVDITLYNIPREARVDLLG